MNKNKIISRFYVIYGDNTPIYVGYTNRTVKQRFKEHQKYKDFSRYNKIEVKEVDRIEFDFTWNMVQVNENAKQVSDRESRLIDEYNTKDSIYQKGLGNVQGGQTWASVKGFVHSNKDNSEYIRMNSKEILGYLDEYQNKLIELRGFISRYQDTKVPKLHNFINHYQDIRVSKLSHFVTHYQNSTIVKLHSFVGNYKDFKKAKLANFIYNYQDSNISKMHSFISRYKDHRLAKLCNFISNYQALKVSKLKNFITHYRNNN